MYNTLYCHCQQQSDKYSMMQKTINVIVYTPGFAGNFLTLVLSLDKKTYPWIPVGADFNKDDQRKEFYSFSSLQDKDKPWQGHHTQFDPRINEFMKSPDYDTMVWRVHPSVYYETHKNVLEQTSASEAKINFLSVHASPEVEYEHVDKFNDRNKLRMTRPEHKLLDKFVSENETFKINLDHLFSTEEDFLIEYDRINGFLNLPTHREDALWLYRDWRKARETERSDAAKQHSNELILDQIFNICKYRTIPVSTKKTVWCVW